MTHGIIVAIVNITIINNTNKHANYPRHAEVLVAYLHTNKYHAHINTMLAKIIVSTSV